MKPVMIRKTYLIPQDTLDQLNEIFDYNDKAIAGFVSYFLQTSARQMYLQKDVQIKVDLTKIK